MRAKETEMALMSGKRTKFKRITVTVDVDVPVEWTIGQTDKWVEARLGPGELRQVRDWEDVDDEWTGAIKAAHPARSGSHDEWGTAMVMVGHRHSKGELVALVNWLLVANRKLKSGTK